MTSELLRRQQRRRRPQAHQCPACLEVWSLRVTPHPAGVVVVCQACGSVRLSSAAKKAGRRVGPPTQRVADTDDGVVVPLRPRPRPS